MKTKEKIYLAGLVAFYLVCVIRYIPGDLGMTLYHTGKSFLTLAPFAVALTIVIVTIMQKIVGAKLPWDRVLRFYLLFAIIIEIFAGVYNYLARAVV
ncbi:MAG: hypothetical protein KKD73_08525 [Proteobacteria bacterium]|nr:hypothetical protein [Pseudomonadota bacterium]MBU1641417.1 hypothetical protein [Pseudomonadota bacterium]